MAEVRTLYEALLCCRRIGTKMRRAARCPGKRMAAGATCGSRYSRRASGRRYLQWRSELTLTECGRQVAELARGGRLQHAGVWSARAGVRWERPAAPQPDLPRDSMTNRTFNILIARVRTFPDPRPPTLTPHSLRLPCELRRLRWTLMNVSEQAVRDAAGVDRPPDGEPALRG